MGREVKAWPMLALLLLVVGVAIGCVLWFMGEAMRNERVAVREKLTEAYRSHLLLVRAQAVEEWNRWRAQLDDDAPAPARFERCVRMDLAESVICFGADGRAAYPAPARIPDAEEAKAGTSLQAELRTILQEGKKEAVVEFVSEKIPAAGDALDDQGRLVAANAELLALELLADRTDPRFRQIAARLHARAADYTRTALPSAQRRFIMRALQQYDPGAEFPTLAAEGLATRLLETNPDFASGSELHPTALPETWSVFSINRRTLALLSTPRLRAKLETAVPGPALPGGVSLSILPPGEEPVVEPAPIVAALGPDLPGWRLALALDDRAMLDVEAAKRTKRHVVIASAVIAAMSALAIILARGFGRQVQLARLKNDLVATVSHELKTPLTAMRALVDTLLDTERLDEKTTREYLQLLANENARLSRLIENFLTFSRLERKKLSFDFTRVPPQQIIDATVAAFGERAHASGCTFESQVASGLPAIRADADTLVTALLNLLDNAWKYSGAGKHIVLRADARNGSVRFAVEDNGIGLAPRDRRRVFDRFYQADQRLARTAGGCGLGLSIVRSIVEAHRGVVDVASEPGRGSTFTIAIPADNP